MASSCPPAPRDRREFYVALVCALPLEADYVTSVFDSFWSEERREYGKAPGDRNEYTTGVIGGHNAVLVHMPGTGKIDAAHVAANLYSSFPAIKLAIVVGVCGAAPKDSRGAEILLGDVIISETLVQYDFGRQYPTSFVQKDSLGRARPEVRGLLAKLNTLRGIQKSQNETQVYLEQVYETYPHARYPGIDADKLYESSYVHDSERADHDLQQDTSRRSCIDAGCDSARLIVRKRLSDNRSRLEGSAPTIHFGPMGSADAVMKSGEVRDQLATKDGIIGFEQEGASIWEWFPSIVIKGVCDYADSHKNKVFQDHAAAVAACCAKAVLKQWTAEGELEDQSQSLTAEVPRRLHHIPFNDLPEFIGRQNEVHEIQTKLFSTTGRRKVAIYGLGGVGKSRLALEVIHKAQSNDKSLSVFWVQGHTPATFEKDFLRIGEKLQIPGIGGPDADSKAMVKHRLSLDSSGRWLMVIDNADDDTVWRTRRRQRGDDTVLSDYIPKSPFGSVLITTRNRQIAVHLAQNHVIRIDQVSSTEAVNVLRSLLVQPGIATDDKVGTLTLVQELSCLPLALVQAAAYTNMHELSIQEYLSLLRNVTEDQKISVLSKDFEDDTRYQDAQNAVVQTWLISFRQIQRSCPRAIEYLSYMSCLHEEDIPQSLLPKFSSTEEMLELRAVLTAYSFVQVRTGSLAWGPLYSMHRLVRLATRNWLREQCLLVDWRRIAIQHVAEQFPDAKGWSNKTQRKLYMPHALSLVPAADPPDTSESCALMYKIGISLCTDGLVSQAVQYLRAVAEWRAAKDGDCSEATLSAYYSLGCLLFFGGDIAEADKWQTRALRARTKLLGPEHIDTLESLNMLALLQGNQGQWGEAETLLTEVIGTCQRVLGLESSLTLQSMRNLALIRMRQARWSDAEALAQKVLHMRKQTEGVGCPTTIDGKDILAMIYRGQGRMTEAEKLSQEAVDEIRVSLGGEHLQTLRSMMNLAYIWMDMGRIEESQTLLKEVVQVSKRTSSAKCSLALLSKNNLALSYGMQERWLDAETLLREVLKDSRQGDGSDNPVSLLSMANLAYAMKRLGRKTDGYNLMNQCLQRSKEVLGDDHPDTKYRHSALLAWDLEEFLPEPSEVFIA